MVVLRSSIATPTGKVEARTAVINGSAYFANKASCNALNVLQFHRGDRLSGPPQSRLDIPRTASLLAPMPAPATAGACASPPPMVRDIDADRYDTDTRSSVDTTLLKMLQVFLYVLSRKFTCLSYLKVEIC